MAIPWLIGAAVVGLATAVIKNMNDDDNDDRDYSSRASDENARLAREAQEKKNQALQAERDKLKLIKENECLNKISLFCKKFNLKFSNSEMNEFAKKMANSNFDFKDKFEEKLKNSEQYLKIKNEYQIESDNYNLCKSLKKKLNEN